MAKPTSDKCGASQLFEADKSSEQSLATGNRLRVCSKDLHPSVVKWTNTQSANGVQTELGDTRLLSNFRVGIDRVNLSTSQNK